MLDLHLHVWPHQPGTLTPTRQQLERYCEAAAALGIEQIAITEHSHRFVRILEDVFPHWRRPMTGPVAEATAHVLDVEGGADLDAYVEALLDAQQSGLPLLIGLEVDYLPGAMSAMGEVIADYPFDLLLGSVHWLDEWLFDAYGTEAFANRWDERDTDEVFAQYVDHVLDLAVSGCVDVLAHIDVIRVAGYEAPNAAAHERRLVEGLADLDVVIEFSSAGLRKPAADTYPSGPLLCDLHRCGAGFTTASDAHVVDQIGADFDVLSAALDRLNIDELVTFHRRSRVPYHR